MYKKQSGILLVANWDSAAGYAWWLMESYWVAISEQYADRLKCHLAYPSISGVPENIVRAPITLHRQDFSFGSWRGLAGQLSFLRRNKIRTIYFTDRAAVSWRYALYRAAGVRAIVIHDHTPGLRTPPRGLKKLLKWTAQRLPWIAADVQIGATEFVRRRLIDVGCAPAAKCFTVPNGLPAQDAEPLDVYAEFGIPRTRKIFATVARATRYKGIAFALRTLAATGRQDWHYLLCGDGPDLGHFRSVAVELGIADQVTFAGNRRDVPRILLGCYAAMHPSDGEVGYSLAILEYMRAGLPVLVPDNPSVSAATDLLTGIIYRDEADAMQGLQKLLDVPEYAAYLGRHARTAVQSYSLREAHERLLDAVDRAIQLKVRASRQPYSDAAQRSRRKGLRP